MSPEHNNLDSASQSGNGRSGQSPPARSQTVPDDRDDLRWSEFRYRTMVSVAPGFIFEYRYNSAGRPEGVWASDGFKAVFGCTMEEAEQRGGWDSMVDEDWKPVARARQAGLLQGEPQSGELRITSVVGVRKWLHVNLQPVRDPSTCAVIGIVGSAYDITTRKSAEDAVRKSEAVLRAVTETTPDWLFLLDERLCVQFMNRPFGQNRPERVLGQYFLDFVPQEYRQGMEEVYRQTFATGVPARLELRKPGPDGQPGNFEHRIMPVVEGNTVRSLTIAVTDVTERKRAENELRTQVRILETMREGVVLVDPANHAIRLTNPAFDRMFGFGPGELLGSSIEPLFSMLTVQRRRLARAVRDTSSSGEIVPIEFECARKDGARFVAACVVTPIVVDASEHWLAVLNDVTERKQLEREIIEIANREQQRIGSDLHDGLGQELTGIALMLKGVASQLRKEGSAARQDVEEVIGLVNNAIESTRTLARGLSPLGTGGGSLGAAIQTLANKIRERFGVRITCRVNFEESLRVSEAAAAHVYRIVQEALTNVVRHSGATEVTISLDAMEGELHLRVADNGRGLSALPLDKPEGLGLRIMRYRAQMIGGDLTIELAGNGGTSVHCSFTLEPGAARGPDRPSI